MQSDHEIWEKLSSLSQFQALVWTLRSDNPLIALGVETREECWTRFQEWLLDPHHHHNDLAALLFATALVRLAAELPNCRPSHLPATQSTQPGERHLRRLSRLGTCEVNSLQAVRAEQRLRRGRMDLHVRCKADGTPLVIIIENKIESSEREGQLQDYVIELEETLDDEVLVPILIQLGEDPAKECTCKWAIRWNREDAAKWLKSGMDLCQAHGLKVPALVQSYLDLFAAFEAKETLIDKHRDLIEAAAQSAEEHGTPVEWALVQEWLTMGDFPFFKDVCQALKPKLQGYEVEPYGTILGRNAGLTVTKEEWYLRKSDDDKRAVNIYFESRWRGDFRLNVCLYPYEGGLTGEQTHRVEGLFATKKQLMTDLREKLESRRGQLPQFELDFSYTLEPDRPNALTIVKLKPHKPTEGWRAADLANLIQHVINTLAGIVDEVADPYRVPTEGPS